MDTSIECDPVCHYVSATSHLYHVSGELNLSVHGRVWCLCRCVQSLRNWQHIVGGCGTGAVAGFVFGRGQAPRGPAPRGPRVPPKPENYADLAHYFSERAQIVE